MVSMTVILLKIIVMVSPGTHLVINHESQSRTNEFQCNQTVNLKTDSRTLYYSILKLKHSPSVLKHNKS